MPDPRPSFEGHLREDGKSDLKGLGQIQWEGLSARQGEARAAQSIKVRPPLPGLYGEDTYPWGRAEAVVHTVPGVHAQWSAPELGREGWQGYLQE